MSHSTPQPDEQCNPQKPEWTEKHWKMRSRNLLSPTEAKHSLLMLWLAAICSLTYWFGRTLPHMTNWGNDNLQLHQINAFKYNFITFVCNYQVLHFNAPSESADLHACNKGQFQCKYSRKWVNMLTCRMFFTLKETRALVVNPPY